MTIFTTFRGHVLQFLILGLLGAQGHVKQLQPPSRSSIWRDPAFADLNPPANYDDHNLCCAMILQPVVPDNCGFCGDPASDPVPRPNEHGGTYGLGIMVANYSVGQLIDIELEYVGDHHGYIQFHLCEMLPESDDCAYQHVLKFSDGSYQFPAGINGPAEVQVYLPENVTCSHCILRLNYRSAKDWGDCGDGTGAIGCGPQETCRHCSDISIQF